MADSCPIRSNPRFDSEPPAATHCYRAAKAQPRMRQSAPWSSRSRWSYPSVIDHCGRTEPVSKSRTRAVRRPSHVEVSAERMAYGYPPDCSL
jgi:hypothetical protein